jgi:chromosome segregation ATPase
MEDNVHSPPQVSDVRKITDDTPEGQLRLRICETTQRINELEAEGRALEEISETLRREKQTLESRIAEMRQAQAQVRQRLDAKKARAQELEVEIAKLQKEIPYLQDRCTENADRRRALSGRNVELEQEISAAEGKMLATDSALRHLVDSVSKINKKLLLRGGPR